MWGTDEEWEEAEEDEVKGDGEGEGEEEEEEEEEGGGLRPKAAERENFIPRRPGRPDPTSPPEDVGGGGEVEVEACELSRGGGG